MIYLPSLGLTEGKKKIAMKHKNTRGRRRNVVSMLCEVSETLTEWKFETITDDRQGRC